MYRDLNKKAFIREAQKLVPSVTEDMVVASFSGVMAQVGRSPSPCRCRGPPLDASCVVRVSVKVFDDTGVAGKDYVFERGCMGGKVLNVRSAPSPGCTASLAIAEHVVNIAADEFKWGQPGR